jgi:hypothetical protein
MLVTLVGMVMLVMAVRDANALAPMAVTSYVTAGVPMVIVAGMVILPVAPTLLVTVAVPGPGDTEVYV